MFEVGNEAGWYVRGLICKKPRCGGAKLRCTHTHSLTLLQGEL